MVHYAVLFRVATIMCWTECCAGVSFGVEAVSGRTFEVSGREFLVNGPSEREGFLDIRLTIAMQIVINYYKETTKIIVF